MAVVVSSRHAIGYVADTSARGTTMEMHQVRYFLAVARVLNFTRAADECNVTQPSLTRAIKQLEAELGGDLFRRERPAAQLTELGLRMHPLLRQCYEAATGARQLASSFKSGEVGALRIALTHSIDLSLLIPHLDQIKRQFNRLEFRFLRGDAREVGEFLKKGEAELGIAAEIGEDWDRLDTWPLFTESFQFVVNKRHPLADRDRLDFDDLHAEQLLSRNYCEHADRVNAALREHGLDVDRSHEISSERDLIELLEADIGVAIVPDTAAIPPTLKRAPVEGLDARRTVHLYGVAGRERTAVASAVMRMLRGSDWQQFIGKNTSA
jgi:DNA-binding transcriptional LysR family regulator